MVRIIETVLADGFDESTSGIPGNRSLRTTLFVRDILKEYVKKVKPDTTVYKETLRSLINIFGNLQYIDSEGSARKVRSIFSSPERSVAKMFQEDNISLPIVSVNQVITENADERQRYVPQIIAETIWNEEQQRAQRIISFVPRPVNIVYEIGVWTKFNEDMDYIVSQVRSLFNPSLDVITPDSDLTKAFIIDEDNISTTNISDQEDRVLQRLFTIQVQTYIPSPKFLMTNTGKIEEINAEVCIANPDSEKTRFGTGEARTVLGPADDGGNGNNPPVAIAGEDYDGEVDNLVTFDGSESFDPDGDRLTYLWDFDDGSTDTRPVVNHTYTKPGTYYATLTVYDGQYYDSDIRVVIIGDGTNSNSPTANAGNDQNGLVGEELNFFGQNSTNPLDTNLQYVWSFGDGSDSVTGTNVSHTFEEPGIYTVVLTVGNGSDFDSDSIQVTIKVNSGDDPPDEFVPPDNIEPEAIIKNGDRTVFVNTPVTFDGTLSNDRNGDDIIHNWNFGDNRPDSYATGALNQKIFVFTGVYNVILRVSDGKNIATTVATVEVVEEPPPNKPPVAEAGDPSTINLGDSATLDASQSFDPENDPLLYIWRFGDGGSTGPSSDPKATHTYSARGVYDASVLVSDAEFTSVDTVEITVAGNRPPIADAGPDATGNLDTTFTFDATESSDPDGDPLTYTWDFADGVTALGDIVTHQYSSKGIFDASVTVVDTFGGEDTDVKRITVENRAPIADASADVTGTVGVEVEFNGGNSTDPDGDLLTYTWDLGDGTTALGEIVTHTYGYSGNFFVELTVSDGELTDIDSAIYTMDPANIPPVADASSDTTALVGETVYFDATDSFDEDGGPSPLTYRWDIDGSSTTDPQTTYVFSDGTRKGSNPYIAYLTVWDGGDTSAFDEKRIDVDTAPIARAGVDTTATVNTEVSFDGGASTDADGDALTFTWNFGDGSDYATGVQVTHTYTATGTYNAELEVDDQYYNSSDIRVITVVANETPTVTAMPDVTGVVNTPITFTATAFDSEGDPLTYQWDFGDGNSATALNTIYTYTTTSVDPPFEAVITVFDGTTSSNDSVLVTIEPENIPPIADIGSDISVVVNDPVTFINLSTDPDNGPNELTYLWDFGTGETSTEKNPTYTYTEINTFTVTLTVSDGEDTDSASIEVTVNENNAPRIQIKTNSGNKIFGLESLPVEFSAIAIDPEGDPITASGWNFGDGNTATSLVVNHTYAATGIYVAVASATDSEGNTGGSSVEVRIFNAVPEIDILAIPNPGRAQLPITFDSRVNDPLDSSPGLTSHRWNFGDGNIVTSGQTVTHIYPDSGPLTTFRNYNVSCLYTSDDENNLQATSLIVLQVNDNRAPNASIGNPPLTNIETGDSINFINLSVDPDGDTLTHEWNFGDGGTSTEESPTYTFSTAGIYTVTLTVRDPLNLTDSDTVAVQVRDPVENLPPQAKLEIFNYLDQKISPPIVGGTVDLVYYISGTDDSPENKYWLRASGSTDPEGEPLTYKFEFWRGGVKDRGSLDFLGVQLRESLGDVGLTDVSTIVEVTDSGGLTSSAVQRVNIIYDNIPPTVNLEIETPGPYTEGDTVRFDSNAVDPDGGIGSLTITWQVDGTQVQSGPNRFLDYTFVNPGLYTVTVTAIDEFSSASDSITIDIDANEEPPPPPPSDATIIVIPRPDIGTFTFEVSAPTFNNGANGGKIINGVPGGDIIGYLAGSNYGTTARQPFDTTLNNGQNRAEADYIEYGKNTFKDGDLIFLSKGKYGQLVHNRLGDFIFQNLPPSNNRDGGDDAGYRYTTPNNTEIMIFGPNSVKPRTWAGALYQINDGAPSNYYNWGEDRNRTIVSGSPAPDQPIFDNTFVGGTVEHDIRGGNIEMHNIIFRGPSPNNSYILFGTENDTLDVGDSNSADGYPYMYYAKDSNGNYIYQKPEFPPPRDLKFVNCFIDGQNTYYQSVQENRNQNTPVKSLSRPYTLGGSSRNDWGFQFIGGGASGAFVEHNFYTGQVRGTNSQGIPDKNSKAMLFKDTFAKHTNRTGWQFATRTLEGYSENTGTIRFQNVSAIDCGVEGGDQPDSPQNDLPSWTHKGCHRGKFELINCYGIKGGDPLLHPNYRRNLGGRILVVEELVGPGDRQTQPGKGSNGENKDSVKEDTGSLFMISALDANINRMLPSSEGGTVEYNKPMYDALSIRMADEVLVDKCYFEVGAWWSPGIPTGDPQRDGWDNESAVVISIESAKVFKLLRTTVIIRPYDSGDTGHVGLQLAGPYNPLRLNRFDYGIDADGDNDNDDVWWLPKDRVYNIVLDENNYIEGRVIYQGLQPFVDTIVPADPGETRLGWKYTGQGYRDFIQYIKNNPGDFPHVTLINCDGGVGRNNGEGVPKWNERDNGVQPPPQNILF